MRLVFGVFSVFFMGFLESPLLNIHCLHTHNCSWAFSKRLYKGKFAAVGLSLLEMTVSSSALLWAHFSAWNKGGHVVSESMRGCDSLQAYWE